MRDVAVIMAASTMDWQVRLQRHAWDHGDIALRGLVLGDDQATKEHCDVFIFDDRTSFVRRSLILTLKQRGTKVLGVYDAKEPAREFLEDRGVDDMIASDRDARDFVEKIQALAGSAILAELDSELADVAEQLDPQLAAPADAAAGAGRRRGEIIVVASPSGGCGATEAAIELTRALQRRPERALLVDADDVRPSIAQRLGLQLSPNIRLAAELLEQEPDRVGETIQFAGAERLEVICGLPSYRDWDELRSTDAWTLVEQLAGAYDHVIVNVGPHTEDLPMSRSGRYGLARQFLVDGDVLVGVGAATPRGVTWLLDWLANQHETGADRPVHLLLNRAPGSALRRDELARELLRNYMPASLSFLPADERVGEADWAGSLVGAGRFTKAIAQAARMIVPPPAGPRRRLPRLHRAGARR
jgi:Mrp family chromosome partitioning ATPase